MQRRAISNLWGFAAARRRQVEFCANAAGDVIGKASRQLLAPLRNPLWGRLPAQTPLILGAVGIGAVLSLAGCGRSPGSFDVDQTPQTKLSNLMALVQFKKLPKQPEPTDHVICPDIIILDGTADDRAYGKGDQTNANVRYQFSLNDVARDCKVQGDQISLKVGAAGKVLLGPVGSPGNFIAPIRVAIVRESDQVPIVSKLYRLAVSVPTGQTEAPFDLVTEPLSIPYTHANAQHDYTIKVGFDATGNDKRGQAMVNQAASAKVRPDAPPSTSSPQHQRHRRANPANANPGNGVPPNN